ncbi:MAG: phage portal protein [Candidatus Bathyarchaeia archaeon]
MSFVAERIRKGFEAVRTRFVAQRQVPPDISKRQIQEEIPVSWKKDADLYGYVNRYMLKGSGAGFVTPPYSAIWEKVWGATPIEDLPKYKDLYTFTPYIKAAIDVTINLAISNGFELDGGDDAVREWLTDWLDEQNILHTLRIVATDMLVFGNAFTEICKDETTGAVTWLKPLDPVHMRVRRNEYGDIFGYIQLLTFPPVVFTAQDMVHFRWGAKSWWYEFSYGTSLLRPLLKIQALIDQLEDDMAVIVHTYSKPMLVVKAGTAERPFSDAQLQSLMEAFRDRKPATDVFVRGDVTVDVVPSMTKDVNIQWWLDYLYKQREAVTGVPKIFLGESEGSNRATAEVVMQEYVTRLRMLQEIISDVLETVLFKQLIEHEFGEGVEVPKVKWSPIWEPTLQEKAKYISDLVQNGIVTVGEARMELGFPEEPEDNEKLPEQPAEVDQHQQGGGAGEKFGSKVVVRKDGKDYLVAEIKPGANAA